MADTDRKKRIERAIKTSKMRYDNMCILSGVSKPDGAHILPRDVHSILADERYNIVPLQHNLHVELDYYTDNDLIGRCKFLVKNCLPEYKLMLRHQLLALINLVNIIKPDMVESILYDLIVE